MPNSVPGHRPTPSIGPPLHVVKGSLRRFAPLTRLRSEPPCSATASAPRAADAASAGGRRRTAVRARRWRACDAVRSCARRPRHDGDVGSIESSQHPAVARRIEPEAVDLATVERSEGPGTSSRSTIGHGFSSPQVPGTRHDREVAGTRHPRMRGRGLPSPLLRASGPVGPRGQGPTRRADRSDEGAQGGPNAGAARP